MEAGPAAEKVTANPDSLLLAYASESALDGKERTLIDVHLKPPGLSLRPVRRSVVEYFLTHAHTEQPRFSNELSE